MARSSEVTETIVRKVAEHEDTSPDELPPLAEKIDSRTYHRLTATEGQPTEQLEFEHLWYRVTVRPDGEVSVTP